MGLLDFFGGWMKRWLGIQTIQDITLEHTIIEDVSQIARDAHPKESLVFLSSTKGLQKGVLHIDELQIQAYDSTTSSASVPLHMLPTNTSIVGTVHSHPSKNNRPSGADLDLFSKFGVVHGIIGYPYTEHTIEFYSKEGSPISVRFV
jgi:proteasome lid subunit RPN8/RPN11